MDDSLEQVKTGNSSAKPMNIGFYRYSFQNRGSDRVVVDYANHLVRQGHKVSLCTCLMQTVFSIHPAVIINKLPVSNEIGFLLYPLFNQLNYDILIFDIIHCAPFLKRNHSGSMVYFAQAHDGEHYANAFARVIIDFFYTKFFKREFFTITVSEKLSNTFVDKYNAFTCITVTNGVDLSTFYPDPDPELVRSKDQHKAVVFFMPRSDHYRKGLDVALEVFRKIQTDTAAIIELWVCGEVLSAESFSFPIKQFGVVDGTQLRQMLSSADVFFYPSRHEGFGLFPLEAMACGCSVVTTSAIPYVKHGENALVAPIEDSATLAQYLLELLHNPVTCKRLGQDGMLFAQQNYSSEKSAQQFEAVLARKMKNGN